MSKGPSLSSSPRRLFPSVRLPGGTNRPARALSPAHAPGRLLWILGCLLLAAALFSFTLGHYPITIPTVFQTAAHRLFPSLVPQTWSPQVEVALFNIRLPRILLAMMVGAGLAVSGATFQAIFHNPIVSPDVLGASSGAAFGAALGILLGLSSWLVTLCAFLCGILDLLLVLFVARRARLDPILSLVLCGIVISSLFSAALSYIKLIADPSNTLPAITYWLMGSLASARLSELAFAAPGLLGGTLLMWLLRWKLNLLSLGDTEAQSMGVAVASTRLLLITAATLTTATAVSICGLIGWIGLLIPHISLLLFGADYRRSLSGTALIGALFTLLVDNAARLLASSEIPIGILTAVFGAPAFLCLLLREQRL